MNTIKVGIIDDNEIVRNVIKVLLSNFTEPRFEMVMDRPSLVEIDQYAYVSPDVILLDINMPSIDGISGIPILLKLFPRCAIIMLTDRQDLDSVRQSIAAGALAYLNKGSSQQELVSIILNVLAGGSFLSPRVARRLFRALYEKQQILDALSQRERSVVEGIANGLSYKLIADRYEISLDTVREHVKRIYRKLNINSKGELLALLRF